MENFFSINLTSEGSGSTGHGVIEQNQEDEGTRQFILCTNNQNGICREKTFIRLQNVIRGYINERGKSFSANPASLKYYRVDFVSQKDEDGNSLFYYDYAPNLLEHVRELVELENGVNFTDNAENAIVLTDEEADAFFENTDLLNLCRRLYVGHDVLLTAEQEETLKSLEIELIVIPDYYYKGLEG